MANYITNSRLRETILLALKAKPEYGLVELVNICSEFTWNQVFCEIDQLSRSGLVHLERQGLSGYTLTLSPEQWARVARSHGVDQLPTR